jgi:hypothetical protein
LGALRRLLAACDRVCDLLLERALAARSVSRIASLWRVPLPLPPMLVLSVKLRVSTTSVSPSKRPRALPMNPASARRSEE